MPGGGGWEGVGQRVEKGLDLNLNLKIRVKTVFEWIEGAVSPSPFTR